MRRILMAVVACAAGFGWAQSEDPAARTQRYEVEFVLNTDGTHTETRYREVKVLREGALSNLKQARVSHSTSVQKAEILEAYTRKPDGRQIDARRDNFQLEVNQGREKANPAFSDWTSVTVIFPDLAVGDTVVLRYRLIQSEAIFPGHFSAVETFPRNQPIEKALVRVVAPASLPVRYHANGLTAAEPGQRDGLLVREWTYSNPKPAKSKRRNWSVYEIESEPGVIISTFTSHQEIAAAYGARATVKAAVTPRVQKLADEITEGVTEPRERARLLYEWVATKITYAGNCVGVGAVVPRDLDFILDNAMGDCKDHATLLEALLSAKGIKSVQALVNAGSSYKLPALPVVSMVNHVINYLPEFDLYVDSTASDVPFGMLPGGDAGKPVLLADGSRPGARTPAVPVGANRQVVKNEVWIQPDGSVKGEVSVQQKGLFAVSMRSGMRHTTEEQLDEMLKNLYSREGEEGSASMERDDPKPLKDDFRFKVKFSMPPLLQLPGAGAFPVNPFYASEGMIAALLMGASEPLEEQEVACSSGYSEEEHVLHLPKTMKVVSIPKPVTVSGEAFAYRSTYELKGNTLRVKRVLDDRTPGHVCSPQMMAAYRPLAMKAAKDVQAQVVYR